MQQEELNQLKRPKHLNLLNWDLLSRSKRENCKGFILYNLWKIAETDREIERDWCTKNIENYNIKIHILGEQDRLRKIFFIKASILLMLLPLKKPSILLRSIPLLNYLRRSPMSQSRPNRSSGIWVDINLNHQ